MTTLKTDGITRETSFLLKPDADARKALAEQLGISGVRKLSFSGYVKSKGSRDLMLAGNLGATVVQPCVVTLDPVVTRIDVQVHRQYLADVPDTSDAEEFEMPEDDSIEPLGEVIDLETVMTEALALELPEWPRADGVDHVSIAVTEPGKEPMTDEDAKPFAHLKALAEKAANDPGEQG